MIRLSDLDELARAVRDPVCQTYILEAINAYYGGANRAAVVSTWAAVVYDVIGKIRELASQGDGQAVATLKRVDDSIARRDISQFLGIEARILEVARDDFEFIAPHEYTDLLRLREDRNRCAHPAFVAQDLLFQPSPEMARAHIVHAVTHLLRHQPIQGKSALDRALRDIKSSSFPSHIDGVCEFLNGAYLDRSKEAFVRNLTLVLAKELLSDGDHGPVVPDLEPLAHALQAVGRRHPVVFEGVMKEKLANLAAGLDDSERPHLFRLIEVDARCWEWLDRPTQLRLMECVRRTNFDRGAGVEERVVSSALEVNELCGAFVEALRGDDYETPSTLDSPQVQAVGLVIEKYAAAYSFRHAEVIGRLLLLPMAGRFTAGDVMALLAAVEGNPQIWDASGTPAILLTLLNATREHFPEVLPSWLHLIEFAEANGVGDHFSALARGLRAG